MEEDIGLGTEGFDGMEQEGAPEDALAALMAEEDVAGAPDEGGDGDA